MTYKVLITEQPHYLRSATAAPTNRTIQDRSAQPSLHLLHIYYSCQVCFAWGLTALSAQIGYIAP